MVVGGGWKAIRSVLRYSTRIGPFKLWRTLRSRNACKACAFGTGGQNGGFWNESRHGIEICNKNIQAHLSDIRPGIPVPLFLQKSISELGALSGKQLEDLGRLTTPLFKAAGEQHYRPMPYDEAIQICAERLRATSPERSFFYASGRSSNEAAFLLQLMARLYGTNNVNNCSYYCHQASGVALTEAIGTGTATVQYSDIEKADLIFVFGANPASNHPRFVKTLIHLRRRGGTVIVVNPAREPGMVKFASPSDWRSMMKGGVEIASEYVQPHLGGDLALIQGVAKAVLENHAHDEDFIQRYTNGFSEFAETIRSRTWEELENGSGVTRADMEKIAAIYARSNHCIFTWSMGLTHHTHGVHTIQTLVSLALLRGMLGKPGAGLLPLRGHSNIQGTGSMGFTPELKKAIQEKLEQKLGQVLPARPGMDTMACMHAADRGEIDVAVMLGGNLLASNPDTTFATGALNKIPFKCYFNPTLNMSHVHGVDQEVMIFPVRARDEEQQGTTQESMFNFVRLSDGGIERFPQLRSEVDLICSLGERLIAPALFDFSVFRNHARVRQLIGDVVPGFGRLQSIDTSKEEFHIGGRAFTHTRIRHTGCESALLCSSVTAAARSRFLSHQCAQ
ncbi:MAG: molybdopterin-dependent oxidoreductase [Cellvibrionaceae bacterium]|nr:molybdopterin-dependent oxidoreductase [Cellvibrionaceae bacterium]